MKKIFIFSIILGALFIAGSAFATVGGPTFVSEIAYSAKDNAVYYKVNDQGGRGCPPIVHKVDLVTLKDTEIKSCTQVENEYKYNEMQKYDEYLSKIYTDLAYMGSVSLKNNNINVAVKFISEYSDKDFPEEILWSNFEATITQDGKEVEKINFKGCTADQPNVFEGYMVPDSDKMGILISNKGDCFEGGYVKENFQVIQGVKYYDKNIVRSFKPASATEPNRGNLIVYAGAGETTQPETTSPVKTNNAGNEGNSSTMYAILAIILGLGLGYFFGRKRKI